jgi:hypothetical protein
MDLEPIPARTARDCARCTVTVNDEPAQPGRDHPAASPHVERCAVLVAGGDFDHTVAQDRLDRSPSDPRPGLNGHADLTIRSCCVGGIQKHGEQGCCGVDRSAVASGEGFKADRPQHIRIPNSPRRRVRLSRERIGFRIERLDDDAARNTGEATMQPPRRLVKIRLNNQIPVVEGTFLIDTRHTTSFRRQAPDPGNVTTRHVVQQIQVVIPPGEPSHRNRPIKPNITRRNRVLNIGKVFKTMRCDNKITRRLGGYVEVTRETHSTMDRHPSAADI